MALPLLVAFVFAAGFLVLLGALAFAVINRSLRSTGPTRRGFDHTRRQPPPGPPLGYDPLLMMPMSPHGSSSSGHASDGAHAHHHHAHQHSNSYDIPASVPADPSTCGDAGWDSPCSADSGGMSDSGGGGSDGGGGGGDGGGGGGD